MVGLDKPANPKYMIRTLSDSDISAAIWVDPFAVRESIARRSLHFGLALGAHLVLLAGGMMLASRPEVRAAAEKIYVRLVELPPPVPEPSVRAAPKPIPVARKEMANKPEPPPILTAPVDTASAASFSVAPQSPVPAVPAPIQAAPSAPPPVTAAHFDADYLQNPKPIYPAISRRLNEEGRVLLRVLVSAEGTALAVEIRKSSDHVRLDEAALDAVRRWRFVPARQGGERIESWVAVPIVFKLEH